MEITILGSGTATPCLARNASSVAVETSENRLLVDIGPGTIRRLCEAGIDVKSVDLILLTHFHADHVSDLPPLLFAANYEYGAVREEPFHLVGPAGVEQFYEALVKAYGHSIVPRCDRLRINELHNAAPDVMTMGDLIIRSRPSRHTFPSLSYRIEAGDVSVTISGDTDFSEDLIELAAGTDLLVCESSFPDQMKTEGHLTPSEAGRIASAAGAGRLVLTHLYPPCDLEDIVRQAAREYSGEIIKARDLMVLKVC